MTYYVRGPVIGILMLTVAYQSVAATASVRIVANIAEVIHVTLTGKTSPVVTIQSNSPQNFDITTNILPRDGSASTAYAVEITAK